MIQNLPSTDRVSFQKGRSSFQKHILDLHINARLVPEILFEFKKFPSNLIKIRHQIVLSYQ